MNEANGAETSMKDNKTSRRVENEGRQEYHELFKNYSRYTWATGPTGSIGPHTVVRVLHRSDLLPEREHPTTDDGPYAPQFWSDVKTVVCGLKIN